jgi:predicted AAA+ superfamily ATPase
VIEQIISTLGDKYEYYFYRTSNGAECDLVIAKGINVISCVEIKFSEAPRSSKGLTEVIADLGSTRNFVLIPEVKAEYPLGEKLLVTDLSGFLSKWV